MSVVFATPRLNVGVVVRGKAAPITGRVTAGALRLATDPLFYAALTLRNVVAGSRYRMTRADTGAELATALVGGSGLVDVTISGVPCYANPQEVDITVRNASGATKYKIFNTTAFIAKAGGEAYILQSED